MDNEQVYKVLKQHFAAFAKQADTPPVEVPKPIRDTLAMVETKYGEKSFVPHNFDEVMELCSYTQRKGFEKLQPMFECMYKYDTFQDLLNSPGAIVESTQESPSAEKVTRVSKQLEDTDIWLTLQISQQENDQSGSKGVSAILNSKIPGPVQMQQMNWMQMASIEDGGVSQSTFMRQDAKLVIFYRSAPRSERWICMPESSGDRYVLTPLSLTTNRVGNIVEHSLKQPAGEQKSEFRLFYEDDMISASLFLHEVSRSLVGKPKPVSVTNDYHRVVAGHHFIRKSGNCAKIVYLRTSVVYEGEVRVDPETMVFTPEGKGVWTQAEPFQRKEGIFKDGNFISGCFETSNTIIYSEEIRSEIKTPRRVRVIFKDSGTIKEGMSDGKVFFGKILRHQPGVYMYYGEEWEDGLPARGKLWEPKSRIVWEGTFIDGMIREGTLYQLAPEETNLPEQELLDLSNRKVITKYEGQLRNGLPNGYGTMRCYEDDTTIVGNFKDRIIHGSVKETFHRDGTTIEGYAEDGTYTSGTVTLVDGRIAEFVLFDNKYYVSSILMPFADKLILKPLAFVSPEEFGGMKMQHENAKKQSAQTAAGESKNPENKSNMMAGRDWSVSEGSLTGGNYYQGGHSTSLSFGARLPLGFWPLFGFSRAMIVNTPCWQARPYSTRGLYQGCLQTVLPLRQPVLKMLFRRFK